MTADRRPKEQWGVLEFALGIAVLAGIVAVANFLIRLGYLPDPFFHDVNDTFMDWYNPAYWAHNPGAYEIWGSVYPPMSFVFLRLFSVKSCYGLLASGFSARSCDRVGVVALAAFMLLNTGLAFLSFRKAGIRCAAPRAIAVGFGAPMLFAWERGNLIVPCFTFFVLAYGRLLRSGWLKLVCAAISVNFKPYLLIAAMGKLMRRDWLWLEGFGVCCAVVYALAYVVLGEGTPVELLRDITGFAGTPAAPSLTSLRFSTSYSSLLYLLKALPLMYFVGSGPIETIEGLVPIVIRLTALGTAVGLLAALWRPSAISTTRIVTLAMGLYYVAGGPGGYALSFLLFFVFLQRWNGLSGLVVLVSAYLWCIPWDYTILNMTGQIGDSYLSGRRVIHDLNLTLGDLVRPGLILTLQLGVVAASIGDVLRGERFRRAASSGAILPAGPVDAHG
ncbi:MAG: hypothetical protein ABI376_07235 [Caulobacteraceae bacterium]